MIIYPFLFIKYYEGLANMSFVRSNKTAATENNTTITSEYAVNITNVVIDKNTNFITINYEIDKKVDYSFMCVTDSDDASFNGVDYQHKAPFDKNPTGVFSFQIADDYDLEKARICLYGSEGMTLFSPRGGKLLGKSKLIKDCLAEMEKSHEEQVEYRTYYIV